MGELITTIMPILALGWKLIFEVFLGNQIDSPKIFKEGHTGQNN
jgi:hypothetical protein